MFADEISFLAAQAGDGHGALPFQKPDHRRHRVLGWNRNTHVHMVRHPVPLDDLALLLPSQRMKDRTQLPTRLAENQFPAVVWVRTQRGTCSPISNGIGSDKSLTLHPLLADFTKPLGEDSTPGTVKPLRVSLV